jgi:hypothetical protein
MRGREDDFIFLSRFKSSSLFISRNHKVHPTTIFQSSVFSCSAPLVLATLFTPRSPPDHLDPYN